MYWYARFGYGRLPWDNSLIKTRRKAISVQEENPSCPDMLIYDSRNAKAPIGRIFKRDNVRYWATENGVYILNDNGKRKMRRIMR